MALKEKAEKNPLTSMIGMLILAAGGLTAFGSISGLYDGSHTTSAELNASHPVSELEFKELEVQMSENEVKSRCRFLKSQIRALADSIYVRKRDGADADYVHTLEVDLADLQKEYDTFSCTRRLS